jgi:RHS repeat-associated protein
MPFVLFSFLLLVASTIVALAWSANLADGDESTAPFQPTRPTAAQTLEAIEAAKAEGVTEGPETDLQAAQTMPHRDLDPDEALGLAEAVFGPQLEGTAGVYEELEPDKFLSDYAAIVPASSLPEIGGESGQAPPASEPGQAVLLESTLPLRAENDAGEEEVVDLGLEHSEGELQPSNPLAEVGIPQQIGEEISLPGPEVSIAAAGAPQGVPATDAEGQFAFYPEVAEDTDLIVAPTPRGVETLTDIRSADAPMETTYELALPSGAELRPTSAGGAEVVEADHPTVLIPAPTAIDAAGDPVQTELSVSAGSITVKTTPSLSTAFPILVDPSYVLTDSSNWAAAHASMAGWTAGTTNASATVPLNYWIWDGTPGLDLTWGMGGNGHNGDSSSWSYSVPRAAEDATVGKVPSTWILAWTAEDVFTSNHGNTATWPALIWGTVGQSGWNNFIQHSGGEPDWGTWGNQITITDKVFGPATKNAWMLMVTYEDEYPAKRRDSFIGASYMAVVDEDGPTFLQFESPTHWMNATAEPILFAVEDAGLGVKSSWGQFEGKNIPGWGFEVPCSGAAASPCPRVVRSGTPGKDETQKALQYDPTTLPTGRDQVHFGFADPVWGLNGDSTHTAVGLVELKVDHTAPELSLSGPLTEQETVGTTLPEYPLEISAKDGSDDVPQSGVAKVEVKVDGKKVTMPEESKWAPGCATQNCPFSRSWTLKASSYALGPHEVEVIATDGVGLTTSQTFEIELGQEPLQTSFTSPHPTFEAHEISQIGFKGTREGKPVEGVTFKCSLDAGETPTTPCSSPFQVPADLEADKWHTLVVAAVDKSGNVDPTPARWNFETGYYPAVPTPASSSEKLVYPETGKKSASYYTLEAEWGGNPEGKAALGVTGVSFEMRLPGKVKNEKGEEVERTFEPVPAACTIDGLGHAVSWPLPVHSHPGHSKPVYLKVRGCPVFEEAAYPEKEIQFRAVFDGSEKVAGASDPAATEFAFARKGTIIPTDATESVGPASVDLLTGAFTVSRTDVSIPVPGYEANLEFTRVYGSSWDSHPGYSIVMGGAWQPSSPLESEFEGEAWNRVEERVIPYKPKVMGKACWDEEGKEVGCGSGCPAESCEEWEEEEAQPEEKWIELLDNEGAGVPFEIAGGSYVAPEYAKEMRLTKEGTNFVLAYPNGTHTIFRQDGEHDWLPKEMSFQSSPTATRMVYLLNGSSLLLKGEVAPSPRECGDPETARTLAGCRSLEINYTCTPLKGYGCVQMLTSISYFGPSGSGVGETVAQYTYAETTGPAGEPGLVLTSEHDPRVVPNLYENYEYGKTPYSNLLTTIQPPGQLPWKFDYEYGTAITSPNATPSRLKTVGRGGATTTIAYGVPVSGTGAPYAMGPSSIATWGQTDIPVDATAVFPPTHVPTEYPPHEYTGATVHYMDPEGHQVNVASPSPPGITGASIATTETDVHGDVVRELDPQNRLYALEASNTAARSHELDSHSVYNAAGTELLESWGPLHAIRLESGETVQARSHTVTHYDEYEPKPPAGTPPAYLPTKETVAVVVPGKEGELEPRTTETRYNWTFRKPEETIVDPGGLNIRSVTKYNGAGQAIETRQPKNAEGGGAGTTKTLYYTTAALPPGHRGECENDQYANLPCRVFPAAQPEGTGLPKLLVKKFTAYNNLDEPEVVSESAGGEGEERTTTTTYGAAGRVVEVKIKGGASTTALELPATKTEYSTTKGLPIKQSYVCVKECTGFDSQATTTEYDSLGNVKKYEDADGNKGETTYDAYGRPVTTTDGRGSQTVTYDPASGLATKLEVSGVGTFTARYDADGDLVEAALPNGILAKRAYNAAGEPISLSYTKTSSCGASCTWFEESVERGVRGQILTNGNTLVSDRYTYDKAGRLKESFETQAGGTCTTRAYTFDADSNRLSKTTRPGTAGACATSGGTTQTYAYDAGDRLMGTGITYDAWGRITSLPAAYSGGSALSTGYFASNVVATQTQAGVTNSFQLDATGRQRQRQQTAGVEGTEVFHYDGGSDSPSWTSLGSTWSRNISGLGGELAAIQESTGTTTFKLTDLHGDVIASASSSPTVTKLLSTYRFDEFGVPQVGGAGRFGWLGGKSRRTELASGVIQMGARSYVPSLGRFLTPDPVPGGSANPYDYADQDPVNAFDLGGTCVKKCPASVVRAEKKVRRAIKHAQNVKQRLVRRAIEHVVNKPAFSFTPFKVPALENLFNDATEEAHGVLSSIFGQSCKHAAGIAGLGAVGVATTGESAESLPDVGPAVKVAIRGISKALTALGGALTVAHETGVC